MRDLRSDNTKFVLMALVMTGHFLEGAAGFEKMALYRVIYIFHMPAFLYLGGLHTKFSVKRVLKLAALYLIAQYGYIFLANLLLPGAPRPYLPLRPYWMSWYLLTYLTYTLAVPVLGRLSRRGRALVFYGSVVLAVAAGFCGGIDGFLSLSRTIAFAPFFIAGYISGHREGDGREQPGISYLVCAALAVLSSAAVIMAPELDRLTLYRSVGYDVSGSALWRVILMAGAFGWIGVLRLLVPGSYIPAVTESGSATLSAYLGHGIVALTLRAQGLTGDEAALAAVLAAIAVIFTFFLAAPGRSLDKYWKSYRAARRGPRREAEGDEPD